MRIPRLPKILFESAPQVTDYKTQKIYDSTAHKELFVGSLRVLLGSTSAREGWGEALTAERMKKCVWVRPELVAQIEFLEWTDAAHLKHSKFAGLRDDKDPRSAVKECEVPQNGL